MHLRALKTDTAEDSSVAFRVGVITSGKGYPIANPSEVNRLALKNLEIFPIVLDGSWIPPLFLLKSFLRKVR
jgi:hypothetical protein